MAVKKPRKRTRLMNLDDRARAIASFSARIREIMKEKKITVAQLARRSGIHSGNLKKYDIDREPGLFVILMLAKGLDVTPSELMVLDFDFDVEK